MESSSGGRCGDVASDVSVLLVTVAQLVFLTFFHEYISWPTTATDGTVARLSMLTDDYFTWLPFPITASIIVIIALTVTTVYDSERFRQAAWIGFSILGLAVTVSLVSIFPFDFSVLPNATAVDVVPAAVKGFVIFMAVFYAASVPVLLARLRRHTAMQKANQGGEGGDS